MPAHNHSYTAPLGGPAGNFCYGAGCDVTLGNTNATATTNQGASMPHNNMPPFYAFAYIIKL